MITWPDLVCKILLWVVIAIIVLTLFGCEFARKETGVQRSIECTLECDDCEGIRQRCGLIRDDTDTDNTGSLK